MAAKSLTTVLQDINPYHALLKLFIGEFAIIGLVILSIIIITSLFIQRPWCKYLCPYGAFLGLFNIVRIKAIVREESTCLACKKCDKACPMNIEVSNEKVVRSHQCISCMECTSQNACPKADTVKMTGTKGIVEKVKVNAVNIVGSLVALLAILIITANITTNITANATQSTSSTLETMNITSELSGQYNSGTYIGEGVGFNTGLIEEVTILDNQITNIEITEHNETIGYYELAFADIPSSIIMSQTTEVDTVSGATRSSEGIIEAVNDALSQAEVTESQSMTLVDESTNEETDKAEVTSNYIDGVYTGSAEGYEGTVTVEVTVENSMIEAIEVVDNIETKAYLYRASVVIENMISAQSTDVDVVSGATFTSEAIINGTKEALSTASE